MDIISLLKWTLTDLLALVGLEARAKFHLIEVGGQSLPNLLAWFAATPIAQQVWQRLGRPDGSPNVWGECLLAELAELGASGAVALPGAVACNA